MFPPQPGLSRDECRDRTKRGACRGNIAGPCDAQNGSHGGQVAVASSKSPKVPRARNTATKQFLLLLTVSIHVVVSELLYCRREFRRKEQAITKLAFSLFLQS